MSNLNRSSRAATYDKLPVLKSRWRGYIGFSPVLKRAQHPDAGNIIVQALVIEPVARNFEIHFACPGSGANMSFFERVTAEIGNLKYLGLDW